MLVDRNCHQSHHYGLMLSGAHVIYLDAYPLNEYSMYGAVPLREHQAASCWSCGRPASSTGSRCCMLTNCTFDGMVYDVERVMQECLAIKPDLVFLWDEAWFAFARFHPIYRPRTAMQSASDRCTNGCANPATGSATRPGQQDATSASDDANCWTCG